MSGICKKNYIEKEIKFTKEKYGKKCIHKILQKVSVSISFDTEWQRKTIGNLYASLSSHGFIVGDLLGLVLEHKTFCKCCQKCAKLFKKLGKTMHNVQQE